MIISNKTLDAVIAVSNALQSISVNDKTFKENLKNLTKQKNDLDAVSEDLRSRQTVLNQTLQVIEDNSAELKSQEVKSNKAVGRAEKSKSDLTIQRTEVNDLNAKNAIKEKKLEAIEKDLVNQTAQFKKYYDSKTTELTDREVKLKVAEDHIAEVQNLMKR